LISGEGESVALAQQKDEAKKAVRELLRRKATIASDLGAAKLQEPPLEGGILMALASYTEYLDNVTFHEWSAGPSETVLL
jgi:hypothetical protein